ncbi:DNA-methyltransferase [Paenibacillus sp. B-A-8]|uniref:DNA-methyltransferase n=1 Tax=Paenibacillus sp. B-A-8 TaxID=3400419 RepID=UPI003B02690D
MIELNRIYNDECLVGMHKIPDKSVDMILCDLPYGTTACKWDTIIPLEPMWAEYERVIKDNGAIVLTAAQPFTSALIMSNVKLFRYCWIWEKDNASNFFAAKFQPLNNTEDIVVFGKGGCNNGTKKPLRYTPQGITVIDREVTNGKSVGGQLGKAHKTSMSEGRKYKQTQTGYPFKTLKFKRDGSHVHPTQKPVDLFRYLIRTYTNLGETVLDNCIGSGTTAVAALLEGRNFIGFETDAGYVDIANQRIAALSITETEAA